MYNEWIQKKYILTFLKLTYHPNCHRTIAIITTYAGYLAVLPTTSLILLDLAPNPKNTHLWFELSNQTKTKCTMRIIRSFKNYFIMANNQPWERWAYCLSSNINMKPKNIQHLLVQQKHSYLFMFSELPCFEDNLAGLCRFLP